MRPLPKVRRHKLNGHKRRALKETLSAHQQFKRRHKIMVHGTWRQNMTEGLNRGFAAIVTVINGNQQLNDRRQKVNLGLHGLNLAVIVYLVGKVLGYW